MDHNVLRNAIDRCTPKRVVVVGDLMLDEYHWCKVARISPEAPVPVCAIESTTLVPGGAANVANNLVQLGSYVALFGVIGHDSSGDKLVAALQKNGVDTQFLIRSDEKPTILKSRIIAHQQHVVRVDREETTPISQAYQEKIVSAIESASPGPDAILISDYLKGTLPDPLIRELIRLGRRLGIPVVIDPKGNAYHKYAGATILTPNFGEFVAALGYTPETESDIQQAALALAQTLQLDALLVTRSEKGMSLIESGQKWDIPTRAKDVYDITGAGDTVIATLTLAAASGLSWPVAASLANCAAGVVVGKLGTSTVTRAEIRESIDTE